ncbi:hypothetical protein SteCoe_8289 [Stentor coeruleus]|uniref:Uncharacterized protein n=1 Tax=Stentor coeruleus TaxID=5963 RepID=A0A1R2CKK5_9CILI|nr:hypothetical protein SteCoe_8289 [Stentor coeruleus]
MDPETYVDETNEKRKKLENLVRKKHELGKNKILGSEASPEQEVYRYEELIRKKNKKKTKEKAFNTAFCVENQDEEKNLHISKEPIIHTEGVWFDQIRDKERKMRREETRQAQDRLKIIDKKTRYNDIGKDFLSPTSRAQLLPEFQPFPRSSSKQEIMPLEDRVYGKSSERPKYLQEPVSTQRLKPRSLSRKELSPSNLQINSNRSPFPRISAIPIKGDLT